MTKQQSHPLEKINAILRPLGFAENDYMSSRYSRSNHRYGYITVRCARGQSGTVGIGSNISTLIFEVGSYRDRRGAWSSYSRLKVRVSDVNLEQKFIAWADKEHAAYNAKVVATEERQERFAKTQDENAARIAEFKADVQRALGFDPNEPLKNLKIITEEHADGQAFPTGITINLNIHGTPEEVARKHAALVEFSRTLKK